MWLLHYGVLVSADPFMRAGNREIVECVEELDEQGHSQLQVIDVLTSVYGPSLPFRARWALAWQLVRPWRSR